MRSQLKMPKHFKAIAAMSQNRVIGRDNKLPWHLPEELKWFKRTTTGHVLIMGRRTFESIGKPLPNRRTIILSQSGFSFPGLETVKDISEIEIQNDPREFFIIGGAQIFAETLPLCSDLYLTIVKRSVEGDRFFPPFEKNFEQVERVLENSEFDIFHYRNKLLA
jgi:dihydrofolate reductase